MTKRPKNKTTEIICYACGRAEFPENTIEAISNCQSINTDWRIEMDLQLTADGEVVLFHDDTTDRTTGHQARVSELNLSEVKALNAGYNFEKSGAFPFRDKKLAIPTLKEVFKEFPNAQFLLDVHTANLEVIPPILKLVDTHDLAGQVVIVSKYDEIVNGFKSSKPEWTYGAATKEVKKLIYSSFFKLDSLLPLKSDILMIPVKFGKMTVLTKQIVQHVLKRDKRIWAWLEEGEEVVTVSSLSQIEALHQQGVAGVFTEHPSLIAAELRERD